MKKLLIIVCVIIVLVICFCGGDSETNVTGYRGTVSGASGNVVELVSGLRVRLLGVKESTEVEMYLKNNFIGKEVLLVADSQGDQIIHDSDNEIAAYVVLAENEQCINHLAVSQYPKQYAELECHDSIGWVVNSKPEIKDDLALYMKQRTFLIEVETSEGTATGTGFFINSEGLAMTNWHVLPTGAENAATAYLYKENPDDSKIYTDKKRRINNILWSEDIGGLDITIFSVQLEQNEKVPYFDISKYPTAVGNNCATFGNPLGVYTASYSAGHISAYRDDERIDRTIKLMQYEMSTNGGNSGGPVCDDYGQIVAVHELGLKTAQGINFGIDVLQIRPILDELGFFYGGK